MFLCVPTIQVIATDLKLLTSKCFMMACLKHAALYSTLKKKKKKKKNPRLKKFVARNTVLVNIKM